MIPVKNGHLYTQTDMVTVKKKKFFSHTDMIPVKKTAILFTSRHDASQSHSFQQEHALSIPPPLLF